MTARRRLLALCAVLPLTLVIVVPAAGAAGPPLPSSASGKAGAVAPGGSERLLTRRAAGDTVVIAVRRGSGSVLRSRRIAGRWSVPPVSLDNRTTGLSADGRTLVLVRPTRDFPAASTRLAVLDVRRLVVLRRIELRGFFTVDAISPDGGSVYLIQYPGQDVLDYRVRALDTRTGRLASRDIVDPRSPDERMGGLPMTRVMSRDGRWAYTLYGGGDETFIHALDTVGRTAACIDLEMLAPGADLSRVRLVLSADGGRIRVRDAGELVATVDTRTFAVHEPGEAPPAASPAPAAPREPIAPPAENGGGSFPWPVLLLAAGAGLCALAVTAARRRGRSAVGAPSPRA
jgi:hypothetical protein